MSKHIFYLFFIHLIIINIQSGSGGIFNKLKDVVKKVKTFTKDGVTLNCFGIPVKLFDSVTETIFKEDTKPEDVRFYFYSREQKEPVTVLAMSNNLDLSKINFSTKRKTVVISHGFMSNGKLDWIKAMTDAFLQLDDLNVIAVDWEKGSNTWNYYKASINTRIVGEQIAKLLHEIKKTAEATNSLSENFGKLHCVGHSLGAHICAHASYQIRQIEKNDKVKWTVERISGLDPAQPCFTDADPSLKLDKDDASYVDVIHTNGRQLLAMGLGLPDQLGNDDFYPNGGEIQIGCENVDTSPWSSLMLPVNIIQESICSHGRSHQLFTDSILVKVKKTCQYQGRRWNHKYDNLKELLKENCDGICPELGINSINYHNPNSDRMYYVPTADKPNYCGVTKEIRALLEKKHSNKQ